MTDATSPLVRLRDAIVARAGFHDAALAAFPVRHEHWDEDHAAHVCSAALGSVDAALAFKDAVLPGWEWMICSDGEVNVWLGDFERIQSLMHPNPAIALVLACLAALIEKETT